MDSVTHRAAFLRRVLEDARTHATGPAATDACAEAARCLDAGAQAERVGLAPDPHLERAATLLRTGLDDAGQITFVRAYAGPYWLDVLGYWLPAAPRRCRLCDGEGTLGPEDADLCDEDGRCGGCEGHGWLADLDDGEVVPLRGWR